MHKFKCATANNFSGNFDETVRKIGWSQDKF